MWRREGRRIREGLGTEGLRDLRWTGRGLLERLFGQERLRLQCTVALLYKHLDFALGGVKLGLARGGEADTFFEKLERLLQGEVALFQSIDDGFELLQRFFKGRHAVYPDTKLERGLSY